MRVSLVFGVVGHLLRPFALAYLLPCGMAAMDGQLDSALRFLAVGVLMLVVAWGMALGLQRGINLYRAEALGVVGLTWFLNAVFGALPYVLYGLHPVDALFESMSGFTTTGATVLVDFALYDRAFFLWRSLTQWFGGLGIIALFVVVLPRLGIAGRQLFFAEASGAPSEAVSPQARHSARRLWMVYTGATVLVTLLLMLVSGFGWYDAVNHALTTMSAGGFSPNPQSIAGYRNPSAEWILSVFMLLSGTSFALQYRVITGRPLGFFRDGEFLMYAGTMLAIALGIALVLSGGVPTVEALRVGAFQASSLMSSTGYASTDYNLWADPARALLVLAMLVGGCAGSAAGGPKVVRLLLVFKHVMREIVVTLHPRAVLSIRYNGRAVNRDIMRAVFTLAVLYMLGHFMVGGLLVMLGSDLLLGFSAALACLSNIGPAFGDAGPMGSFSGFSYAAKVVLTVTMWVGRLEIVTVLALLHPEVLRSLTWRATAR